MASLLNWFVNSDLFRFVQLFVAWFPVLFAYMAINSSRQLWLDRRGIVTQRLEPSGDDVESAHRRWPLLSVVVPTRNGSGSVGRTLDDVRHLAWPGLEIIVVDDGSTDDTWLLLDGIARDHQEIHKAQNQGKSLAMNDAIDLATGGLILICDDDALLPPSTAVLLAAQLAHHPDLAAVTANPRMLRTEKLIEKLQAVEFSTTVSTQRRGTRHGAEYRRSPVSARCSVRMP